MKKSSLPRKIPSEQLALFPFADTFQTIKKSGLSLSQVEMLFNEGFISFNPVKLKNFNEEQHIEFVFVSALAVSNQTLFSLKSMLEKIEKPYLYSHEQIYYNFSTKEWETLPEKTDQALAPLQEKVQTTNEKNQIYRQSSKFLSSFMIKGLIKKIIFDLKSIPGHNNSKYKNAWEEYLEEVIGGKSLFWQIYMDTIKNCSDKNLDDIDIETLFALALGEAVQAQEEKAQKNNLPLKNYEPDILKKLIDGAQPTKKELIQRLTESISEKIHDFAENFVAESVITGQKDLDISNQINAGYEYISKILERDDIDFATKKILINCLGSLKMFPELKKNDQYYICSYHEFNNESPVKMKFYSLLLTNNCFELAGGSSNRDNQTSTIYRFIVRQDKSIDVSGNFELWYDWMVSNTNSKDWNITVSDIVEFK